MTLNVDMVVSLNLGGASPPLVMSQRGHFEFEQAQEAKDGLLIFGLFNGC